MKKCPTCQKTYADTMKFCQTDGTPLVEDAPSAPSSDPYKTIAGSINSDDILQIPESDDPMKTLVNPAGIPKQDEPKKESASPTADKFSASDAPKKDFPTPTAPPKSSDSTPNHLPADSTSPSDSTSSGNTKPRSYDATFSSIEPPAFGTGSLSSPFDKPSNAPFGSPSKDDPPPTAFGGAPFDAPKSVPPPYKEPENFNAGQTPYGAPQAPFGQSNDPFGASQTPFGQPSNDPYGAPQFGGQNDWNPPPAPVANWQNQGIGADTPFQPPVGTGGQNQTLAIVSLITGILGLCCLPSGIAALITGYMAKNNAETNPAEYSGRGMALAGMILGGVSIFFTIIGLIVNLLGLLR